MSIKSFDDLDITDPIMFGLVFSNKHIAQPFIEHLLDIKIDHLETPIPEAVLSYDAEHKGVRYDVFARETDEKGETIRSFDLEMQMVDTKELPQRARYYQSICDGVALSKGDFYTNLKEQYVIFLCPMDIFGRGFPIYHFENRAREDINVTLNDRTFKNFYIFRKYEDFTDPVVKAYMMYFATKNANTRETETIHDQVSHYKADTLIRSKFMTYEFDMYQSRQEGRAEGKAEGKIEGKAEGKAEEKLEMVDAMLAKTKLTDEEISSVSGIPQDEIAKRRAQRQ